MVFLRLSFVMLFSVALSAQTDSSPKALFAAIQGGAAGEVDRLLKSGVSANLTDADGTPALMAATLFGNAQMVEILLQHGAEPNRAGASGTTALMWAVPDLDKVRFLLAHGANPMHSQRLDGRRCWWRRVIQEHVACYSCCWTEAPTCARRTAAERPHWRLL